MNNRPTYPGGYGFDQGGNGMGGSPIAALLAGIFNNSGRPYEKAGDVFNQTQNQGISYEQPFYGAGVNALSDYQNYLNTMKNPSQFINNLMGQYQQSPWAKFSTQQGIRAANNQASAGGLIGSTPLAQQNTQFAEQVSGADMNQWLQNVLGVNAKYGEGEQNLMEGGRMSGNAILDLISQLAGPRGEAAYGQAQGQQYDKSNIIGAILSGISSFL